MKTTKKDFKLFKKECTKWIDILGLKDWAIDYEHESIGLDILAQTCGDTQNRHAFLQLDVAWDTYPSTPALIKRSAFHEVCELFLMDIRMGLLSRTITEIQVDTMIHQVIRTLENVLYPAY